MVNIRCYQPGEAEYLKVQLAVQQHYRKTHGASPTPKPDQFWCLTDSEGNAPGYACAGITWGGNGKLFSEHYLDYEIQTAYSARRSEIIELGSLCSFEGRGFGGILLKNALQLLESNDFKFVLLTATEQVRSLLNRQEIAFDDLGAARVERVRDGNVNWGSYYENDPRVICVSLQEVFAPSTQMVQIRNVLEDALRRERLSAIASLKEDTKVS